jgi:metallo-beta-lactamase family protein
MKISFFGAARTVTGSQHLVEIRGHRILLDCGLFQGKRKETFELNRRGFFDAASIDALILSHAHIDHSGNIPSLVRNGMTSPIYCTPATRDLCEVMLLDSAHIQEKDVEFVNKRRLAQGKKLFEPLYTQEDAQHAMRQFTGVHYGENREILPGIFMRLIDAGHLLGSATVILDADEAEGGRRVRLVYSGDIGQPGLPIIRDPVPVTAGADVLLIESTYGNRLHPPYAELEEELGRIVRESCERGGVLLIPSFAVGRAQQVMYAMHRLYVRGEVPRVPVYVDSPLAVKSTEVFLSHPETYDDETRDFLLYDGKKSPFAFKELRYVQTVEESKSLNSLRMPGVIISASGMLESGRILHHLSHRIEDPKNTILITGWQAPNTLGRKLVEHQDVVSILGETHRVRARIEKLTSLSGHADRQGLLRWACAMRKKPSRTFVVHGETDAAVALAQGLENECGFGRVEVPGIGDSFVIGETSPC